MLIRMSSFYWLKLRVGVDQIVSIYWLMLSVGVDQIVSILLAKVECWC